MFLKIINGLASFIFFMLGLFALGYFIYRIDDLTEWRAISILAYSLAMFFFSFRHNLSSLSVFGLKAELKSKIKEADDIIDKLRKHTVLFMKPSVATVASLGRLGSGFSHKEKWEFKRQAIELMRSMGIGEKDIDDTMLEIHRYNLFDLMQKARDPLIDFLQKKCDSKNKDLKKKFPNPIKDQEQYNVALNDLQNDRTILQKYKNDLKGYDLLFKAYETLIRYIDDCDLLSDKEKKDLQRSDELNDLKYYCEHKDFMRPDKLSNKLE